MFRLIDADMCTVYVPNEDNAEDIARLRAGMYSKALIRRLGRSSVNVYRHEYEKLVSAAVVEVTGRTVRHSDSAGYV